MSYLNLDLDYFEHPKTIRLMALINSNAALFPIKLWAYVGKFHAVDGRLKNYSTKEVEGICGWVGKEGELIAKMCIVGYLGGKNGSFFIPDWKQHQGHIIAFKKRARQANTARWKKYYKQTSRNPKHEVKESPLPNLTLPNLTLPNLTNKAVAGEAEFLEALKTNPAYSHVDINTELGKIDAWLSAHPGRKKTRRFVVNWLNKIEKPLGATLTKKIIKKVCPICAAEMSESEWQEHYKKHERERHGVTK